MRSLVLFLVAFVALAWSTSARAQSAEVTGGLDTSEVELGDVVTYTMQASSSTGAQLSDPKLSVPGGLTLVDSGQSPSQSVTILNGHMTQKQGLNVSWVLRTDRLGTFTIGPASIQAGAVRKNAPAHRLTVVAPGSGRKKPRGRPLDPFGSGFDPFKGLFPGFDDEPADPYSGISTDPKLALPGERAPQAFLHATVDKTRAVVGEQVTLTVYLYEDLHARQGRITDVHEAMANDFVKRSLLQDESRATHVGNAIIGGKAWAVKLVRKSALFPIKAGRLEIGPMALTLTAAKPGYRESEPAIIEVVDPPVAGRPPGYQPGDTGDFSLSATLSPRTAEQDGAVGVTVELRGTGNMPSKLPLPEIAGVEWLEPQTRDTLGAQSAEKFGGTRTFNYVVRLHKAGAIDLGEIKLPFWNAERRAYDVARAAIGIVAVTPGAGKPASAEPVSEMLPGLPGAHRTLEGTRKDTFVTERPVYWLSLLGAPFACVLGIALTGAVKRARERRATEQPSPERIARERRNEADVALRGTDGAAAISAIARSLEAEIFAWSGVNVRGTSREDTRSALEEGGMNEAAAKELLATLAALEDARFSPTGVTMDEARGLASRAKEALAKA